MIVPRTPEPSLRQTRGQQATEMRNGLEGGSVCRCLSYLTPRPPAYETLLRIETIRLFIRDKCCKTPLARAGTVAPRSATVQSAITRWFANRLPFRVKSMSLLICLAVSVGSPKDNTDGK